MAQKTKAICDADYGPAVKEGKINLCDNLKRALVAPEFIHVADKASSSDIKPTIDDIKKVIERNFKT